MTGEPASTERRYGGRTADERRAERRQRLLATALDLFGTDGYAAVGIERICSTAGVTARHFYEEVGSRHGLLVALYDQIMADAEAAVLVALAGADHDQVATTRAGLSAFLHSLLDDPRRARVACLEVVGVSPEIEAHRREVLRGYALLVQLRAAELGLEGRVGPRGYGPATLALVGGTNELIIEWLHDGRQDDVEGLVDELVWLFVAVARAGELPGMDALTPR